MTAGCKVPGMSTTITIHVHGAPGSGKTAVAGAVSRALADLGLHVRVTTDSIPARLIADEALAAIVQAGASVHVVDGCPVGAIESVVTQVGTCYMPDGSEVRTSFHAEDGVWRATTRDGLRCFRLANLVVVNGKVIKDRHGPSSCVAGI